MKKVCFTAVDDRLFYPEGTHIFINSFKRFHPDIDLVVFRQDVIDKLFKKKGINWYQAKPYLAELLFDKYNLVCNIDADTIILDRLTKVFDDTDYDVGAVLNFNDYENASFENISEEMYLQAGMVASTKKEFWLEWQKMNDEAMKYLRKENDTLNLLIYNKLPDLSLRIFDKDRDYYGCKSLGREPLFYIKDGKTYCSKDDGQVIAYHFARGNLFPKLYIPEMPLTDEVKSNWNEIATFGQSICLKGLRFKPKGVKV